MTTQTSQVTAKSIKRVTIAAKICMIGNLILAILSPVFFFAG